MFLPYRHLRDLFHVHLHHLFYLWLLLHSLLNSGHQMQHYQNLKLLLRIHDLQIQHNSNLNQNILKPLSANPIKLSNTLKQFVYKNRQIV